MIHSLILNSWGFPNVLSAENRSACVKYCPLYLWRHQVVNCNLALEVILKRTKLCSCHRSQNCISFPASCKGNQKVPSKTLHGDCRLCSSRICFGIHCNKLGICQSSIYATTSSMTDFWYCNTSRQHRWPSKLIWSRREKRSEIIQINRVI